MIFLITFSRWSTYFQARISLCRLLCPFVCSLSLLARGHINLWWSIRAKKMHENEGHAPKDIESWQMYVTCMCMCVNTICMSVKYIYLYFSCVCICVSLLTFPKAISPISSRATLQISFLDADHIPRNWHPCQSFGRLLSFFCHTCRSVRIYCPFWHCLHSPYPPFLNPFFSLLPFFPSLSILLPSLFPTLTPNSSFSTYSSPSPHLLLLFLFSH